MEHALLVAEDDFRGADVDESLQAIVADDDAAIEVVQVGGGKASTIQRNERPKLRRDDGHHLDDHPLGSVAPLRCSERLDDLQPLQGFVFALLRGIGHGLMTQVVRERVQIDTRQEVVDGLGTDLGDELVRVGVFQHLVVLRQGVDDVQVFLFGEEVHVFRIFSHTRLNDYVALVIDDRIQLLRRQAKQVADLVGQRPEVPNVSDGHDELDVP